MPNLKLPTNRLLVVAIVAASTTVLANILWALASGGTRDALTITGVMAFAAASGLHAYVAYGRKFLVKFLVIALLATLVIDAFFDFRKGNPMTFNFIVTVLSVALTTSTVFAVGNHAGGHADSDAISKPGKATNAKRTVKVEMLDTMRFNPQSITVKQGETIKFIVKNSGKVKHEMVLGTEKELKSHENIIVNYVVNIRNTNERSDFLSVFSRYCVSISLYNILP